MSTAPKHPAHPPQKPPVRGPIVEDVDSCGGLDEDGAATIVPKTPDGHAPAKVKPTDPREK